MRTFIPKWQILKTSDQWANVPLLSASSLDPARQAEWKRYGASVGMVLLLTGLVYAVDFRFDRINIAMLYLIPVVISAVRFGLGPAITAACTGLMAFDFFFVPPIFSYTVSDLRFLVSFAVFLLVAMVTASLASNARRQTEEATTRAAIAQALYVLSRELNSISDAEAAIQAVLSQAEKLFGAPVALAMIEHGDIRLHRTRESADPPIHRKILEWVYEHGELAGFGSKSHRQAVVIYLPVRAKERVHGVLCLGRGKNRVTLPTRPEAVDVLKAMANLLAISLTRLSTLALFVIVVGGVSQIVWRRWED
ncbi:DUF4118 domain-containing protein, partial [Alicyclobacillus cellulosilyticus]|uniref:DUF4118 domain-containing protein n=1 Tax=Alicyclobacillus cellulosilyticus TaxID=1003997 RepID=UPI00166D9922